MPPCSTCSSAPANSKTCTRNSSSCPRPQRCSHGQTQPPAADKAAPFGRVAAIFTLKQLNGAKAHDDFKLASHADIAEFALRALTDRASELKDLKKERVNALDSNARVRAQALISLGRLGDSSRRRHPSTPPRPSATKPIKPPPTTSPTPAPSFRTPPRGRWWR